MDAIQKNLLEQVADLHVVPEGAYNIRVNGKPAPARFEELRHLEKRSRIVEPVEIAGGLPV